MRQHAAGGALRQPRLGLEWLRQFWAPKSSRLIDRLADPFDDMLRVLMEQAGIGIVIMDHRGDIIRVNESLRRMVGPECGLAAGQPAIGMFSVECQNEVWAEIVPALQGSRPPRSFNGTLRAVPPREGAPSSVRISALPLREADGQSSGVLLHLADISAQRQLETQLAQSQKFQAVGQLAAGIAHDFNNLLTAIIGAADEALERPVDKSTLEDLYQIRTSADRGADLVRQLLAFSRQQALQPRVIAIDDAVVKLSALLQRLLGHKVKLELQLGSAGHMVRVDPTQLDQVLVNLAVNARHAMAAGGLLTMLTRHSVLDRPSVGGSEKIPLGHYIIVEVQDTGIGMPPAMLSRIFDPFFTTRREQGGSGLGLSTVHGVVRQSGGYLEVESVEGEGTTFRIYLPCSNAPTAPNLAAAPFPVAGAVATAPAGRLVLLVDDEAGVRRLAATALLKRGWTVLAAESGEAALALLEAEPAQVGALCAVISDVVMPGMDGPALVRILRTMRPDIPVILTSGYAEAFTRDGVATDDVFVLAKPYTLRVLLDMLEQQALPTPSSMIRSNQQVPL